MSPKTVALHDEMRELWEQHVYFTRMQIISAVGKLPDLAATTDRLMRNPGDIAAVCARYYPKAVADKIQHLFTEHLQIAGDMVGALINGQTEKANELKAKWYQNADDIAAALAPLSPAYDKSELQAMMRRHLDLTSQEAAMRLAGNYPADIAAFGHIEEEALLMADYLSNGIIKKFPGRF